MADHKDEQPLKVAESWKPTDSLSRRSFLGKGSAALALTATLPMLVAAQQTRDMSGDNHTGINERQPGPINKTLDASEPDSVFPPETDAGGQPPFKYPFSYAHKRIEAGGDAPGDRARLSDFQEDGWRRDATYRGWHSRIALACRRGMGLHDCGIRAYNGSEPERTRPSSMS